MGVFYTGSATIGLESWIAQMKEPSVGYMDTVTICNSVGATKERRLTDWKKTKRAKNLLIALSTALDIEQSGKIGSGSLVEYESGRGKRAWLHPNLVDAYKAYLANDAPLNSRFLYLIKAKGTNFYKIGVATDKTRRLATLQNGSPLELTYVVTKITEKARDLEQSLHAELKAYNVRGEWFELNPSLLKTVIKTWLQ